jgi:hypothetical protein
MEDSKLYKIGDRVRHCEYNTLGQVIDYGVDGSVYVQWENGTTGYYGMWHLPLNLIKKA